MAKVKISFTSWKQAVDLCVNRLCGMSSDDLPDWCYADAYAEGMLPATAARRAVKAAKEY